VLSLFLLALAWPVYKDPLGQAQSWRWMGMLALGGGAFLFSMMLLGMRGMAYVQTFPSHLKLVTPFLRFNISYKRLQRYTTAEIRTLFLPDKMRGWTDGSGARTERLAGPARTPAGVPLAFFL
jgi:hypothetical protein